MLDKARKSCGWFCGDDGRWRPAWANVDAMLRDYYDDEWGRPVYDERGVFERISLEAFQAGLSWATILRKREAFREVFDNFEADKIAQFDQQKIERLMQDARIIRNHRKILATIQNAKATIAMRPKLDLAKFVWSFQPKAQSFVLGVPSDWLNEATTSTESIALAKALKNRGFSFVGPTTMYALMQALGMIRYSDGSLS